MAYDPSEKFNQPVDAFGPLTPGSGPDTLLTPEALEAYVARIAAGEDRYKIYTEMAREEIGHREALEEAGLLQREDIPYEAFMVLDEEDRAAAIEEERQARLEARGLSAADDEELLTLGGPGSGYFGHAGRPGEIGGSSSDGGGGAIGRAPLGRDGVIPIKKKKAPKAPPVSLEVKQKAYAEVKAGATFKATHLKYGMTHGQLAGYVWHQDQIAKAKAEETAGDIESLKQVIKAADVPKTPTNQEKMNAAIAHVNKAFQKPWMSMSPQEKVDAAIAAGYVWKPKPESKSGNYAWYDKDGVQSSGYGPMDQGSVHVAQLNHGAGLVKPPAPELEQTITATATGAWPVSDKLERSLPSKFENEMRDYNQTWVKGLTSEELNAFGSYTSGSGSLNKALRNGTNTSYYKSTIAGLSSAIAKTPNPPPPDLVWRGINDPSVAAQFANLNVGDQLPMGGFQSCTIKPIFAYQWSGGTKLVLEIKPKKGAYVEIETKPGAYKKVTNVPGEWEYILDHGKHYTVRGVAWVKMHGVAKPVRVVQLGAALMAYDPKEKFNQPPEAIGPVIPGNGPKTLLNVETRLGYLNRLQAGEDRETVIREWAEEEMSAREALVEAGLLMRQDIPDEAFDVIEDPEERAAAIEEERQQRLVARGLAAAEDEDDDEDPDVTPDEDDDDEEDDDIDLEAKTHVHPEGPIHDLADSYVDQLRTTFKHAFSMGRQAVLGVLVKSPDEIAERASDAIHTSLAATLPRTLLRVMTAGGELTTTEMRHAEFRTAKDKTKDLPKKVGPLQYQFNGANPRAAAWAREHAGWLIDGITQTSREKIQEAIAQAQEGKITLQQQWEKIAAAVGDEERATTIARTESMTAVNAGQREAWDQAVEEGLLPPKIKKMWIATGDEGVCPECEKLDGRKVRLNGKYPSPGDDGPPAHPNCRCTEGLV